MEIDDRGRLLVIALLGLAAVGIGVTAVAGFVVGDDQTSGEDVLSDVQEKYNTADSVAADAVVTVESDDGTAEFDVEAAAAGDGARLNVSDGDRYVLTGTTGEAIWVSGPEAELTGVIEQTGDNETTFSLRAGNEEPAGGLSAIGPGLGFDGETTVGELREEFGEELPAEFDDALGNVSDDTTLEELPAEIDGDAFEEFDDDAFEEFDGDFPAEFNESAFEEFEDELPDEINESTFEEFEDELPAEFNESAIEAFGDEFLTAVEDGEFDDVLPEELVEELPESVSEFEDADVEKTTREPAAEFDEALPDGLDDLDEYESVEALTGDLEAVANETEVELVGTTTVDGEEANELLITHPDAEGETRLYTSVETDEILKQVTTTPEATVTVEVTETRFDVSPADSTFEPPGATEIATVTVQTTPAHTPAELDDTAPFAVAVPGDSWTFERGAVTATDGSLSIPGVSLPTESFETTTVTAVYTADERTLAVTQRALPDGLDETTPSEPSMTDIESVVETELETGTTTTTVGDREVVVTTTDDGTVATWVDDESVVTVAGDLDRDELESVIAGIELGVDA